MRMRMKTLPTDYIELTREQGEAFGGHVMHGSTTAHSFSRRRIPSSTEDCSPRA